ncbi:hypothetical protein [Persephonella sp.]
MYILGIITGILISILILVLEVYLKQKGRLIIEQIIKSSENKFKEKGEIIDKKSPEEKVKELLNLK